MQQYARTLWQQQPQFIHVVILVLLWVMNHIDSDGTHQQIVSAFSVTQQPISYNTDVTKRRQQLQQQTTTFKQLVIPTMRQQKRPLHLSSEAVEPIVLVTNLISQQLLLSNPSALMSSSTPIPITVQVILNQMVLYTASSTTTILKPATGHSQPLWGPPDPYLTAGHSIAPPAKALVDMGIIQQQELNENVPESVKGAVEAGYQVLDYATIKAQNLLPGFSPVRGILPFHDPTIPTQDSPISFFAQVEWAAKFSNVIEKLPEAAFVYALIEFFILRPGIDLYKEDIELQSRTNLDLDLDDDDDDDNNNDYRNTLPTGVLTTETIAVTGVRLGVFCFIATVTNVIYG